MLGRVVSHIKANLLGVFIGFAVVSFIFEGLILTPGDFYATQFFGIIIVIIATRSKYRDRLQAQKRLKQKGLTHEDLSNIDFVKNWEVARRVGPLKYCFLQGGLSIGLITFPLSLMLFVFLVFFSADAEYFKALMYPLALVCLIVPYVTGVLIYAVRYQRNQHRFHKLTDPLNLNRY
ncbi:hypothetical protein DYU05_20355 [Mucilaginibacter terrenus]|uniref:Uncharacterized protein n=1 Tax=Mucilaginibacter terrenus TaxID=2482727 RepID=A0A3E2NJF5_9SPHI|nr:hypothetical protein [Mucilaginibacter terrenus]RFZ81115.1 hypothetical protein DYU05_20355 [Mucilaginibacter terrenus]